MQSTEIINIIFITLIISISVMGIFMILDLSLISEIKAFIKIEFIKYFGVFNGGLKLW